MIQSQTKTETPDPFISAIHKTPAEFHNILTDGGAGDLICELVAVDYNIRNYPETHFHVWVPDYLLEFAKHVLPPLSTVRPFSRAEAKFRHDIQGMSTQWITNHTCMRTHPVDYGFHMLSDRHIYDLNKKNYLQVRPEELFIKEFHLPEKYVCLVSSASEPIKAMPIPTMNALIDYVLAKGYTPVFIGKEKAEIGFNEMELKAQLLPIDRAKGIDLTNKTTLCQAAGVIAGAKCIIGLDGGMIHLAGCTDTWIVAGYTLVDPIHVAPIRKGSQTYKFRAIEPDANTPNRYYQTYGSGFKKGDYRKFPGWQKVVANMTADKFIPVLNEIL